MVAVFMSVKAVFCVYTYAILRVKNSCYGHPYVKKALW